MFFRKRKLSASQPQLRFERQPIPAKVRFEVLKRDGFTCRYCGAKGPEAGGSAVLEIDHRIPVSKGGTNDPQNLVTSCSNCNRGKGATLLDSQEHRRIRSDHTQWESCRVDVQVTGNRKQQTVIIRADRYGAGEQQTVFKPKTYRFRVALPEDQSHHFSWSTYFLYLPAKEQRKLQKELDAIDKQLRKSGWQQVTNQEYRRRVKTHSLFRKS